MKLKCFRSVRFKNDWELNLIGKKWSLRIGRSQLALWRNYEPLFCFFRRYSRTGSKEAWHDPVM